MHGRVTTAQPDVTTAANLPRPRAWPLAVVAALVAVLASPKLARAAEATPEPTAPAPAASPEPVEAPMTTPPPQGVVPPITEWAPPSRPELNGPPTPLPSLHQPPPRPVWLVPTPAPSSPPVRVDPPREAMPTAPPPVEVVEPVA